MSVSDGLRASGSSVSATPVVTMIGGGQLARMTHQASIALGQTLRVLAHAADEPAAQVTPDIVLGSHTELDDLRRAAKDATVVTFDHEHVPTAFLETLQGEGVNVQPPPSALIYAQDKTLMRRKLRTLVRRCRDSPTFGLFPMSNDSPRRRAATSC